jgi:hypothetical protein
MEERIMKDLRLDRQHLAPEVAEFIVRDAARWCGNILGELLDHYGERLPKDVHSKLRAAVSALHGIWWG